MKKYDVTREINKVINIRVYAENEDEARDTAASVEESLWDIDSLTLLDEYADEVRYPSDENERV